MRALWLARAAAAVAFGLLSPIATWAQASEPSRPASGGQAAAPLRSQMVGNAATRHTQSVDGVVEAVRQTQVSAQVSGAIVQLNVKVGDVVKAGQVLLRIDARAAEQASQASEAQAQAARAGLQLASRELARQQELFKQRYISQAAFEQAEAQYKSTQAQVNAQLAQLALTRTQGGFNVVQSPYDGVIAELPVALGDMAMPGRPLLTVYDPKALRVTASLAQSQALSVSDKTLIEIDLPGQPGPINASRVQLLPTVDAATHTLQLRLDLPALPGVAPGMFARLRLPATTAAFAALSVPSSAVVRRAEMTGIYVLDRNGRPLLRQIRLGAQRGEQVDVLSGLSQGERIALDPLAAGRFR